MNPVMIDARANMKFTVKHGWKTEDILSLLEKFINIIPLKIQQNTNGDNWKWLMNWQSINIVRKNIHIFQQFTADNSVDSAHSATGKKQCFKWTF